MHMLTRQVAYSQRLICFTVQLPYSHFFHTVHLYVSSAADAYDSVCLLTLCALQVYIIIIFYSLVLNSQGFRH